MLLAENNGWLRLVKRADKLTTNVEGHCLVENIIYKLRESIDMLEERRRRKPYSHAAKGIFAPGRPKSSDRQGS